jgi:5'-3' exonuclease
VLELRIGIHLVDGTYELFRHYYALPSARDSDGREVAAVRGVLTSVLGMMKNGATHVAVVTDLSDSVFFSSQSAWAESMRAKLRRRCSNVGRAADNGAAKPQRFRIAFPSATKRFEVVRRLDLLPVLSNL